MAPKKAPESNGDASEPRRSGRIASQPPPALAAVAPKPASKAKPASRKRPADEETAEAKKPASKKAKPESKAAVKKGDEPEKAAKPASKAAAKPASKAAAKPASKVAPEEKETEKPASKAKPASTKAADKPASKSAAKPKSGKGAAAAPKEDAIPEEKEDVEMKGPGKSAEEEKEKEAPKDAKAKTGQKGEVELGEKLPSIRLKNNKSEEIDVSTLAGNEGVVIFTYPKADTPGCTKQACGYRDSYDEFSKLGYKVYGLSSDQVSAQQKWVDKQSFQYELLADPDQTLIKALGCFVPPKNTKRSHFIFEKGTGKLVDKKIGVKPESDPTDCVKFIKAHHK